MASKRKKSKPTRIAKENGAHDDMGDITEIDDDALLKIQRFIEEGSEDTPDSLEMKFAVNSESMLSEHEQKMEVVSTLSSSRNVSKFSGNLENTQTEHESEMEVDPGNYDIKNACEKFPAMFVNGHIPSNLQFHQLMEDEVDSIANTVEESIIPDKVNRIPSKTLNNGNDEFLSFKQVARTKKSPGKRAKPSEDETPRYSCHQCKYVTNRSDHYKRHLMTHSSDKPLKCTVCSYGTGRSDHYKRHLQRHGMSERDIIETCYRNGLKLKNTPVPDLENLTKDSKENVQQVSYLSEEKSTRIPERPKKHQCDMCSYSTDKSSHLTRHKNSHSKSIMSHCDKCNKSFRTPSYLSQHKCTASNSRCPKCRKIFLDRPAMLRHIVEKHHEDDALIAATTPLLKKIESESLTDSKAESVGHDSKKSEIVVEQNDSKPIDLSVSSTLTTVTTVCTVTEETCEQPMTNDSKNSSEYAAKKPSNGGNLGCTKCGEWFNKLNEYSSHPCVS